MVLENVGDGLAGGQFDLIIGIDKRQLEATGQAPPNRRFAAAGHAHQHNRARAQTGADLGGERRDLLLLFASVPELYHLCPVRWPLMLPPTLSGIRFAGRPQSRTVLRSARRGEP